MVITGGGVQVDLAELAEHMAVSRSKHSKDGVLQLQLLASWLARTFSGVHYHLGVIIEKAGVGAAITQPWGDAVAPLQKALVKCAPPRRSHSSLALDLTGPVSAFHYYDVSLRGPCTL